MKVRYYRNTTDLPDRLVQLAIEHNLRLLPGIEIDALILRNKKKGSARGNWGKYYSSRKTITLNVPRRLSTFADKRPYTKRTTILNNRVEWLVMVMAHEMRHAYQYQVDATSSGSALNVRGPGNMLLSNKRWKETDAELFEDRSLKAWRAFVAEMMQPTSPDRAANTQSTVDNSKGE